MLRMSFWSGSALMIYTATTDAWMVVKIEVFMGAYVILRLALTPARSLTK